MATTIHHGEALQVLGTMPDDSGHVVVTSPPYFGEGYVEMARRRVLDDAPLLELERQVEQQA